MTLSVLLDLSDERSVQATEHFMTQLQAQPGFFMRLMKLREEIANGDQNSALTTLITCFGIDGVEAMVALKAITQSLQGSGGGKGAN